MLLSKITIVHILLLCDQSIPATKTLWKDDRCPRYWGFHCFSNWNFPPSAISCFKTAFILPGEHNEAQTSIFLCLNTMKILLAKLHWSLQEGNAKSVCFPNTFKDERDLKKGFQFICVFPLAFSSTYPPACDANVLFPLPKIAATQANWSVWPLLCWRGQGANRHENCIDLLCVQGKSGVSRTA